MKNYSSSGELSESAGLNDFLNVTHKQENNYLPSYQVKSNLIPNHTYGKNSSSRGDMLYSGMGYQMNSNLHSVYKGGLVPRKATIIMTPI